MVERYVLVGTQRVPFVLVGPGGVFTLCATDGAWTLYDLEVLSRLGDELRDRLPGYRGRVEAVVCLAFDWISRGEANGGVPAVVAALTFVTRWARGFEPDDVAIADIDGQAPVLVYDLVWRDERAPGLREFLLAARQERARRGWLEDA